jgi:hypothetical protein
VYGIDVARTAGELVLIGSTKDARRYDCFVHDIPG